MRTNSLWELFQSQLQQVFPFIESFLFWEARLTITRQSRSAYLPLLAGLTHRHQRLPRIYRDDVIHGHQQSAVLHPHG